MAKKIFQISEKQLHRLDLGIHNNKVVMEDIMTNLSNKTEKITSLQNQFKSLKEEVCKNDDYLRAYENVNNEHLKCLRKCIYNLNERVIELFGKLSKDKSHLDENHCENFDKTTDEILADMFRRKHQKKQELEQVRLEEGISKKKWKRLAEMLEACNELDEVMTPKE